MSGSTITAGLAVALAALAAAPAGAATLTVTTTSDSVTAGDGACSLREAVVAVDAPGTPGDCGAASADANTIVLGAHTYTLTIPPTLTFPANDDGTRGDLNVTAGSGALTIAGAGAAVTTISAATLGDRLFDIAAGANVAIRDLTLTGGHAPDGAAGQDVFNGPGMSGGAGGSGGAIRNAGTLTVTDATITLNVAGHGGNGGGFTSPPAQGSSPGGVGGSGGAGGGIYNAGTLTLTGVTVTQNHAGTGGNGGNGQDGQSIAGGLGGNGGCCGDGGGIANAGGTLVVSASTISANHAGDGGDGGQGGPDIGPPAGAGGSGAGGSSGGGISSVGGSVSITNSTLSSNVTGVGGNGGHGGSGASAPGVKGGAGGGAGFGSAGGGVRVTSAPGALVNVTVYANQVGGPGTPGTGGIGSTNGANGAAGQPAFAGGVYDTGLPATSLTGTLLADNQLGNCGGVTLEDGGHNLSFGDALCPPTFATGDPHLGVLADNGGPTQTFALGPGSAAIDTIPATGAGCPATDQRGAPRPGGASCDIGAYEIAPPSASVAAATDLTTSGATINGSATANDAAANTHFEYGLTPAYGSQTTAQPIGGAGPVALSAPLTGLTAQTTYHYRLVATSADGTTASADATFTTPSPTPIIVTPPPPKPKPKPKLTKLKIAPAAFRAGAATHKRKSGATISYTDSLAAKTTFVVLRATAGVTHGSHCVKKPKHGHGTACTLLVKVGSFTHADRAAANALHFTGRLGGRTLARGSYRLQATPKLGTTAGATVTVSFRIV